MENCLFCKIIAGDISSKKIAEDEFTYAFHDINPQAPVHALVICKNHVKAVCDHDKMSDQELAACLRMCEKVAVQLGLSKDGYRVVTNCGDHACQSVHHLHFHVLGGEKMSEKMA